MNRDAEIAGLELLYTKVYGYTKVEKLDQVFDHPYGVFLLDFGAGGEELKVEIDGMAGGIKRKHVVEDQLPSRNLGVLVHEVFVRERINEREFDFVLSFTKSRETQAIYSAVCSFQAMHFPVRHANPVEALFASFMQYLSRGPRPGARTT